LYATNTYRKKVCKVFIGFPKSNVITSILGKTLIKAEDKKIEPLSPSYGI
jgi:hypothetical protein